MFGVRLVEFEVKEWTLTIYSAGVVGLPEDFG